jgi:hypothetical protein
VQAADGDAADLRGHGRVEPQLAVTGLEAEHRLDEDERRSGRPGLGAAGSRVRHREAADRALEARERLGEAVAGERGRLQLREGDPVGRIAEACRASPSARIELSCGQIVPTW